MNYTFFIFILIVDVLSTSFLFASYAWTEQQFKMQAEKAWPDVTDAKAFEQEIGDFLNKNPLLPIHKNASNYDSCFFQLPKDLYDSIWFYKTDNTNDRIILQDNANIYTKYISKAFVIRDGWMQKKGLVATTEPQPLCLYYGLLKGLFLEKEGELFLQMVCGYVNTQEIKPSYTMLTVCVLKESLGNVATRQGTMQSRYSVNVMYSVMITFMLHKLLGMIRQTTEANKNIIAENQQEITVNPMPLDDEQSNGSTPTKPIIKKTGDLVQVGPPANDNKVIIIDTLPQNKKDTEIKNNKKPYLYYAIPATVVVSGLIFLWYKYYFLKKFNQSAI